MEKHPQIDPQSLDEILTVLRILFLLALGLVALWCLL